MITKPGKMSQRVLLGPSSLQHYRLNSNPNKLNQFIKNNLRNNKSSKENYKIHNK
jgi:hypothetical protein